MKTIKMLDQMLLSLFKDDVACYTRKESAAVQSEGQGPDLDRNPQ